MFIIIVFWLVCNRPCGLLYFILLSIFTPLFLPSSSVCLSYFILAVPMRECLGKQSCTSSNFQIEFFSLVQEKHYYRHSSWCGRANHSNKKKLYCKTIRFSINSFTGAVAHVADCWSSVMRRDFKPLPALLPVHFSSDDFNFYKVCQSRYVLDYND